MKQIAVYILLTALMQIVAFGVGRLVDIAYPALSLWAFLAMFFFAFFAAWQVVLFIYRGVEA